MTYQEYLDHGAGTVPESAWPRFEAQAYRFLNRRCFDRLDHYAVLPKEAKYCMAQLAEQMYQTDQLTAKTAGISAESVDGHSVTFDKAATSKKATDAVLVSIIKDWMEGTGLTYAGV